MFYILNLYIIWFVPFLQSLAYFLADKIQQSDAPQRKISPDKKSELLSPSTGTQSLFISKLSAEISSYALPLLPERLIIYIYT